MCKPTVRRMFLHDYGPCGFTGGTRGDACAAFSLGGNWRERVAGVLRRWADKAEGVRSYTIVAKVTPEIEIGDVGDAMVIGLNGASKYLNDLRRDRLCGTEAAGDHGRQAVSHV